MRRLVVCGLAMLGACLAHAGTITVTSPARGSLADPTLVGSSTSVAFSLRQMGQSEAKISITIRRQDNSIYSTIADAARVTPSTTNDDGSGTYNLTFLEGTPEQIFKVEVRATPIQVGATTYNADQDLYVLPDLTRPKILSVNPLNNSFVKRGIIPIKVRISEANLKDWRVQINNQDIPNNTGTTVDGLGYFTVNWDNRGIVLDGAQTATIRIRDNANNEATQSVTLTRDQNAPVVTIMAPANNSVISAGTSIDITVDITEFSSASIAATGVDVVVRTTAGVFIGRVARRSMTAVSATAVRWTGRIRWGSMPLPSTFKIEASAIDKAGNGPSKQTVTVRIG